MSNLFLFANMDGSTLAGPINNAATTLTLASGGGALFPSPTVGQQFSITLIDAATGLLREICYCTARSSDTLTVARGQEGTVALSWAAGDLVQGLLTAGQMAAMLQISQFQIPQDQYPGNNFYVAPYPTGNDISGFGTAALPWATVAHAIAKISQYQSQNAVTINVAAGTYVIPAHSAAGTVPPSQIASWNILGAGASSTIFNCTALGSRGFGAYGSVVNIDGVSVGAYYECYQAQNGGALAIATNLPCNMTGSSNNGIASYYGSLVNLNGNMTISGSYGNVFQASPGTIVFGYHDANVSYSATFTFSGSVTVSGAVVQSINAGYVNMYAAYVAFAGTTPTGQKFYAGTTGGINGGGGGLGVIPGTVAGAPAPTIGSPTYGWTIA
jgi:hypothetical protein